MASQPVSADALLAVEVAKYYADPYGFVLAMYPWGQPGPLKDHPGPDKWQGEFLKGIGAEVKANRFDGVKAVSPLRRATSSGHGIGKSVMVAWLVNWLMATRPHAQGTITANTFTQLETKTWAAIQRWTKLCVVGHWFTVTTNRMYQNDNKDSWFCAPQSSKDDNSEAFAGQHAADSTSFYVFDEDSAIPDKIHEVAEGGLTDGEPMIFVFGNPTRNSGHFYDVCFGRMRSRWSPTIVDSRDSRFTNKEQIKEWEQDYGEDSDFFRVRVRGLPPSASDAQFIDQARVLAAQRRSVVVLSDEPLVAGADLAWGGGDDNVIRFRRGLDAKSIPPIRIKGEFTRDPAVLTNRLADVLTREHNGQRVRMLFLDSAGIAGPIAARLRQMGHKNVQEINFGSDSPDPKCRFYRDYMWQQMKEWLLAGSIDSHPELEADLTGPGIRPDNRQRVWLESKETMKKRGVDSPDDGDALCFVGSTMVLTPSGERSIDSLRAGDWVVTPFGTTWIDKVHKSNAKSLADVMFSNGKRLVGRGAHEMFTFSRGVQPLDALVLTDEVEAYSAWRLMLWRLASISFIGAGSIGFKAQAHTFSPGSKQTRSGYFIAGCGRTLMGLYLKASRFITKTATGVTTRLGTLSWPSADRISASTCASVYVMNPLTQGTWHISDEHGRPLLFGMEQPKGSLGIESMASGPGNYARLNSLIAQLAEDRTALFSEAGRGSVHRLASRRSRSGAISRLLGRVRSAVRNSWLTVIGRRPVVPVSVATANVQPTPVYNLTLRHHNAYYANGILAFNCLTFAATVKAPVKRKGETHQPGAWGWA